ncbi:MAG: tryptophan--tRNA ligase [Bacteroidota bacterium]
MRILTGIQSSNIPHLGNILGAISPALQLAKTSKQPSLFFIADLHALTSKPNTTQHTHFIHANVAAWLACGLDINKDILYRQSHLPQVCELAWYLNCLTPYNELTKAHAFKEKSQNLPQVNLGLFTYPVLMAADILLYQPTHIPVGTDQLQHIEMARDLAKRFNQQYSNIFTLPKAYLKPHNATLPGTDGRKMSKSYHNTLSPFWPEKDLYNTIKAIPTASTPLAKPQNPDTCPIFNLYKCLASQAETTTMREKYLAGGYGYMRAKKALFELIITKFATQRATFNRYMQDPQTLQTILANGQERAQAIAQPNLQAVRQALYPTTSPT